VNTARGQSRAAAARFAMSFEAGWMSLIKVEKYVSERDGRDFSDDGFL
jgi:hypothetical protein